VTSSTISCTLKNQKRIAGKRYSSQLTKLPPNIIGSLCCAKLFKNNIAKKISTKKQHNVKNNKKSTKQLHRLLQSKINKKGKMMLIALFMVFSLG
jgi:hypothetical protein